MLDDIVIVVDLSNYKPELREDVPFKAVVIDKYEREVVVASKSTGILYELYYDQILESMEIEDIKRILDLTKY